MNIAGIDLHPCSSSSPGISPVVGHEDEPAEKKQRVQEDSKEEEDEQERSAKRRRGGEEEGEDAALSMALHFFLECEYKPSSCRCRPLRSSFGPGIGLSDP